MVKTFKVEYCTILFLIDYTFGLGKTIDRLIGLPTLRRTFEKRHCLLKEWADQWNGHVEKTQQIE